MPAVNNGFLFDDDGVLQVSAGPIAFWNGGIPFDADGKVVGTTDDPVPSDAYIGGLRVSPTKGVYALSAVPPPTPRGFSNGFSNGFGV